MLEGGRTAQSADAAGESTASTISRHLKIQLRCLSFFLLMKYICSSTFRVLAPTFQRIWMTWNMRHRSLFGVLCLLLTLAACGGGDEKLAAIPEGQRVLAFGDSVTHGTGAGAGEDWPSLLAEKTGWQVINAGVPGDTAQAGKSRIRTLLDEHRPALVIIEIGGNDFLRRRPPGLVKEDIRELLRATRAAGAQPVLVSVPELSLLAVVSGRPADSPIYAALGDEERVPVISGVFSDVLARPELCADRIHPNAEGYRYLAEGILAALKVFGLSR